LMFSLTVTDTGGLENTDSCIVNITWQNDPPTAEVSPDYTEVAEGTFVTMDGSGSKDPDGVIASYNWSQIEGEPVTLSDPTAPVTTFTAPKTESPDKNIKLKLTVKDNGGLQGEDESSIFVIANGTSNTPPNANFEYAPGKKLLIFTDRSTDDGKIVSWHWDFGDWGTSNEQNPSHRYVKFGKYAVTLTVTDDHGASHSISQNVDVTN
ncbi:MAG: PKD domain-containing protein, partial [Desulfobacterales bacterium]